jgi:hypothetical protein
MKKQILTGIAAMLAVMVGFETRATEPLPRQHHRKGQ